MYHALKSLFRSFSPSKKKGFKYILRKSNSVIYNCYRGNFCKFCSTPCCYVVRVTYLRFFLGFGRKLVLLIEFLIC